MSKLTDGFESRVNYAGIGRVYSEIAVDELLAHARALEEVLKNIRNDPMLTLRVQQVWKIDELLE